MTDDSKSGSAGTLGLLRLGWIPAVGLAGRLALPVFLVSAAVIAFLGNLVAEVSSADLFTYAALTGIVVGVALEMFHRWAFYRLVTCPSCGNGLNIYKNGKKVPEKNAYTRLRNMGPCRHCGWEPAS